MLQAISYTPPGSFAHGANGEAAQNLIYRVTFGGNWNPGDDFVFDVVTSTVTYSLGTGRLTKIVPIKAVTLNNRVHFLSGTKWYFSDNAKPMAWEQQNAGAGFIDIANQWQDPEDLISLAPYQGRMAVYSQRTIQIWVIDANPLNFAAVQTLANIGSYCALGPQSIGDLDVIFPSTTGFRSLRVRDSSLGAFVNDIGSPVDANVQADIVGLTPSDLQATCSIVEPSANRYWHYLEGQIYVLSYFPAAKIMAAWSIYMPTLELNGVKKTFIPQKFVTYNSIVYARVTIEGSEFLVSYGGTDGNTFDGAIAIAATTWLDLKTPTVRKNAEALDYVVAKGSWKFSGSMDWAGVNNGAPLQQITKVVNVPSYQLGQVPWSDDGFHVKLQAQSEGNGPCVLSSLVLTYQQNEAK